MAPGERVFNNILVIHFGQLGDVVLGLPALTAVRKHFTNARVTVMSGRSTAEIIRIANVADEQIAVDRVEIRDGNKLRSMATMFKIVRDIRWRKFDLVIDLHSLYETNLLGFISGSKSRLYANRENRSLDRLANFLTKPPKEDKSKHLTDRYLDVLLPLGIKNADRNLHLRARENDVEFVRSKYFSDEIGRLVGLFPGAGHPSRCWKLENFAALAKSALENDLTPVVFLGPEEVLIKDAVHSTFPAETVIVDGLTIAQFIAAASQVDVFVTNDTGPLHLAAAAGVAIVVLLDERAPTTYLPTTKAMEVVRSGRIDEITVEQATAAMMKILL